MLNVKEVVEGRIGRERGVEGEVEGENGRKLNPPARPLSKMVCRLA